jgi:hypothetical protein
MNRPLWLELRWEYEAKGANLVPCFRWHASEPSRSQVTQDSAQPDANAPASTKNRGGSALEEPQQQEIGLCACGCQ